MRVLFFGILVLIALTTPYFVAIILSAPYAFRYTAYELIVLGVFLDALLGASTFSLFYTIVLSAVFLLIEALKPFLIFYEEQA